MAEREQTVAHDLARSTQAEVRRGQSLGFLAAMTSLVVTAFLGYLGHAGAAGVVGTTTVVGLASAFVVRRNGRLRGSDPPDR